jgi:hypothetical protein
MPRGAFRFETTATGDLANSAANVETLRSLFLDRFLVAGDDIGPGDRGDFDRGAWHVACHIAGAGGVRRHRGGGLMWLEISHRGTPDEYFATVTTRRDGRIRTVGIDTADGRDLLKDSALVGFVEGTSLGRVSARGVLDAPDRFNSWRRQDFDHPPGSPDDGGKVWEHWCTLRDIRASDRIGTSMLSALIALASALGDRFFATVTRGRREYGHPVQLAAMVYAGLVDKASALWDTGPAPIPAGAGVALEEADPAVALAAIEQLAWSDPQYYMFSRKISGWSAATQVAADLEGFTP